MSQIELFNYDQLSPDLQVTVKLATERIKMRMKRTAEDIIEIGKDLIAIKEQLPHGQFLPWISSEFEMSQQTASNFMAVASRFDGELLKISNFKPSIIYQLAAPSTPDAVVEKAIEKSESGESLTVTEIKRLKAEAKELEQRNKDLVKVVNSERQKNDQLAFKLEKTEEELGAIAETKNREFQVTLSEEIERAKTELEATIEKQNEVIQKQQAEFERFKKNPDPKTRQNIQDAQDALTKLEGDRRQAESKLNDLRTEGSHAKLAAIQFTRFKGALEKVFKEHPEGFVACSSPYLSQSMRCDAETLSRFLKDIAKQIDQGMEALHEDEIRTVKVVDIETI